MAKGRLDEVVPLEPAAMPGRVVIQWDKDDCADLGIIKVDLLGLGMLAAIEEMMCFEMFIWVLLRSDKEAGWLAGRTGQSQG